MSRQNMGSDFLGKTVSGRVIEKTKGGVLVAVDDVPLGWLDAEEMRGASPWEWQQRLLGLNAGDEVLVKVVRVGPDRQNGAPTLLLSEHEANLDMLAARLTGTTVNCHVVEKTPHGVFVDLRNGLEGLVHICDLQGATDVERHARLQSLEDGQGVTVQVMQAEPQCDGSGPRIGLKEVGAAS